MLIKETFEIKPEHRTGHVTGLVVVLDGLASADVKMLTGRLATIRMPSGNVLQVPIDEAKDHGPVHSLFFKGLTRKDIPDGSEISLELDPAPQAKVAAAASK